MVGVDGSREAKQALRWVVAEAKLRGAGVRVVHAWSFPYLAADPGIAPVLDADVIENARRVAEELVDRELGEVATETERWDMVPIQQTFVAGATQATSAGDYALLLSTSPAEPDEIVRLLASGRADGVILMETLAHDPRITALQASGHSFTLIGRTADTTGLNFVDIDFGDAVRKSLNHLAELGHQCVALFNFPRDQLDAGYTSALIARDAFEQATAELDIRGIHLTCPHPAREALAVATELLQSEPECTAAITTGWQFTGLLSALRVASLHVPDEFSIVSVIAAQFAEMLTPALTGIEWPAFEAGRLAAEMLIERLAGGAAPPHQLLVGGELVIRQSTGPARPRLASPNGGARSLPNPRGRAGSGRWSEGRDE